MVVMLTHVQYSNKFAFNALPFGNPAASPSCPTLSSLLDISDFSDYFQLSHTLSHFQFIECWALLDPSILNHGQTRVSMDREGAIKTRTYYTNKTKTTELR